MQEQQIKQWGNFEASWEGPKEGNPFIDVSFKAIFKNANREVEVNGFYAGEGQYTIRFMPDQIGEWYFQTESSIETLNGLNGEFQCIEAGEDNHGPVIVSGKTHFSYSDGKPFYPFGTTAYVWNYQNEEVQEQTYETLKNGPFNKIRMCVFPKHYDYNLQEPLMFPFVGSLEEGFDFSRFDTRFFDKLEEQIARLEELNIEVDLILFHPYDRWGFKNMGKEADRCYLSYIIARLASFRNIWWSLANEYDLIESRSMAEWDDLFKLIQKEDPSQHLRSIHNWHRPDNRNNTHWYDHCKPWVTHASIQHPDTSLCLELLALYEKPVIYDECRYEGNLNHGWGNLTAERMVQCFWEGVCQGGYVTHGETFMNPNDVIWWSHGGKLYGESPDRIAFLRTIIEEGPVVERLAPFNFEWTVFAGKVGEEYLLAYFGDSRPSSKVLPFSENEKYKIDIVDTWEMTITHLEGEFAGGSTISLPSKPYSALRARKI